MPYRLLDANGETFTSLAPGLLGGNRRLKIYGRLDCTSARRALARGYAKRRVFFADEATAIAAGYRPCATCMLSEYRAWKAATPARQARPMVGRAVAALCPGVALPEGTIHGAEEVRQQSLRRRRDLDGTVSGRSACQPLQPASL
jgi:hypothetical protein